MTVKDLKEIIEKLPDNAELRLVGYDRKTGKSTMQHIHICCNTEHQQEINQVWFSNEGLRVIER